MALETLKKGIDAILHPDSMTKGKMDVWTALRMYYAFSVVPVILLVIVSAVPFIGGPLGAVLGGAAIGVGILVVLLEYWLLIPFVVLFAESGVLHALGNLVSEFKGSFDNTFSAVVYSSFVYLSVAWIIGLLGIFLIGSAPETGTLGGSIVILLIEAVVFVWGVYVLTAALANQHKTTKWNAFKPVLVVIVVGFILLAIAAVALVSLLGVSGLGGTGNITASGLGAS